MWPLNSSNIAFIIGGLGIFLFGLYTFSEYLKDVAGNQLKSVLNFATKSPWIGLLSGALLAAVVQSSSVVTVVALAFVNSGLLTFEQSLGLIFGANIGTTITAQIIAFNITEWGFYLIPIGLIVIFIAKRRKPKAIGYSVISFGFLLMGLYLMKSGLKPLRSFDPFIQTMASFGESPLRGIAASSIFTGIVQSSSATTSLVVTMAQDGLIHLKSAIPLILGANIGTTVTAALAAIGANRNAKRVALSHFIFNLTGVIVIYFFIANGMYEELVVKATDLFTGGNYSIERLVANSHTVFNVAWSLFWCWQVKVFTKLIKVLIPGETKDFVSKSHLDNRLIATPSIALDACRKELSRMASIGITMIESQVETILKKKPFKEAKEVWELEKVVNEINRGMIIYLKNMYTINLTELESKMVMNYMHVSSDLERWGDHATNLFEVAEHMFENQTHLAEGNVENLEILFQLVHKNLKVATEILSKSQESFSQSDLDEIYRKSRIREKEVDRLSEEIKENNVRIYIKSNSNEINIDNAVVVNDIIINLERVADHSYNIIKYFTVPPEKDKFLAH